MKQNSSDKKGQDLAVLQMAQFKVIPRGPGTNSTSLQRWSNRPGAPGLWWCLVEAPACTITACPQLNASSAEQQELDAALQVDRGTSLLSFSLSSPSPDNSSFPPALFANHVAQAGFYISFFLKEKKKWTTPSG